MDRKDLSLAPDLRWKQPELTTEAPVLALTQAAFPAGVLVALLGDGGAAQSQAVGEQPRAAGARVGDGHEGLGRPHGGRQVRLDGLLPRPLVQHLDHGVFLYDLGVQVLYPGAERRRSSQPVTQFIFLHPAH